MVTTKYADGESSRTQHSQFAVVPEKVSWYSIPKSLGVGFAAIGVVINTNNAVNNAIFFIRSPHFIGILLVTIRGGDFGH